ncbi:NAD-dependent epimerase/dehydratase family protein [Rhodovibrionaceae bacterium A322]
MFVLVTGAAGFIGSHVSHALLDQGAQVLGLDSLNDYYDPALKTARLERLEARQGFEFAKVDLGDRDAVFDLVDRHPDITHVLHLAAQAGVRYSLIDPFAYVNANVMGQLVVMEACRRLSKLTHLVYASSSSVYGANEKQPFSESDRVDQPVSIYAATKRAGELLTHSYSGLHDLPAIGLRFFTVYGPWGRPDMAYYGFTEKILAGEPINLFNHGNMRRDFTYIDDIVQGILACLQQAPKSEDGKPAHKIYNLGNNQPETLKHFVELLEKHCGRTAEKNLLPMQPGDVHETYADIALAQQELGFQPKTSLDEGLARFMEWYKRYHQKN